MVVAVFRNEYCPCADAGHTANNNVGIFPNPFTSTNCLECNVANGISENSSSNYGILRNKLALFNRKRTVNHRRVYVFVANAGSNFKDSGIRNYLGNVESDSKKVNILEALNGKRKFGNFITVIYRLVRNGYGHVGLCYNVCTAILTLVIFIYNFQNEFVLTCVDLRVAQNYNIGTLCEIVRGEMLFSIVNKAINNISELENLLSYVYSHRRTLGDGSVRKNEFYTKAVSSRFTNSGRQGLNKLP